MKQVVKLSLVLFGLLIFNTSNIFAQKKVKTFTVSHIIDAPIDDVWKIVGEDYGAIANSHPRIIKSDYINGTLKGGEGAERVCYFNENGSQYLYEKQTDYNPKNYTFKNQVFQAGKFPVDPAYTFAIYKLEKIDEQTTRFTFDMTFRTKPAFMGSMMKGNFKKLIENYAIAIEHHVKTGEVVNKENFKTVKKEYKSK